MKYSNDPIGNRTRDFLICSRVPQPTAPPRTPVLIQAITKVTEEPHVPIFRVEARIAWM